MYFDGKLTDVLNIRLLKQKCICPGLMLLFNNLLAGVNALSVFFFPLANCFEIKQQSTRLFTYKFHKKHLLFE